MVAAQGLGHTPSQAVRRQEGQGALAKIAGIKLCQAYRWQYGLDFISAMPTNLYGPGDNFELESSHVVPALLRKTHEAKASGANSIEIWGSGTPRREFLYVDDCADAVSAATFAISSGCDDGIALILIAESTKHVIKFAIHPGNPG